MKNIFKALCITPVFIFAISCSLSTGGLGLLEDAADTGDDAVDSLEVDVVVDLVTDTDDETAVDAPPDDQSDPLPETPDDPVQEPEEDPMPDPEPDPELTPDPEPDPDLVPDPEPEPDLIPDFIPDREINLDRFMDYIAIDDELPCIDSDEDDACFEDDCDDLDPNNWDSCDTCTDGDGDGWYVLCDAYVTVSGPDCDDSSGSRFPGNPEVCDGIDNDCDSAGDDGLTCITATNGGPTYYLNVVQTDLCIGVFCAYDDDVCRCIPTPLDIRQRNRSVIAIVDSSCDGMFLAVLHDAMGGGGGGIDGTITNDPGSAFTDEVLLIDDYWGEDPCDYYSSTYFECEWGWSSSWGGDGMCAGFYVSNVCMTLDFYNTNDMDGISLYDGATGTYTDFAYSPDVILCIRTLPDAS